MEELEEDIDDLRDKISDVLDGEDKKISSSYNYPKTTYSSNNLANQPSTVSPIDLSTLSALNAANNVAPINPDTGNDWDKIRFMALSIAGIIILLAVIVFMVAMLTRK